MQFEDTEGGEREHRIIGVFHVAKPVEVEMEYL
jgi:hypothetical protein